MENSEINQCDVEGLTNLLKRDFHRKELQRVSVKGFKSVTRNPVEAFLLNVKGTIIIEVSIFIPRIENAVDYTCAYILCVLDIYESILLDS